jgi:predicted alpha/beta-hydrolase family hydrolase
VGHLLHSGIEGGLTGFRGRPETAHLADELQGGGGYLVRSGWRFRAAENFDAAAHKRVDSHYAVSMSGKYLSGKINRAGLVLTHGAGGNAQAPLLLEVDAAFTAAGFLVVRYDLPFRQKRPSGPPSPAGAAADRAGLHEQVMKMRGMVHGPVFLGGHSYGGRQSTMLAAEQPGLVDGLVLFSYPLHPPGKAAQLRTAHFSALQTPAVFVHGTKDNFGTPEEMRSALALIPARSELILAEGAGHDLKRGRADVIQAALKTMKS